MSLLAEMNEKAHALGIPLSVHIDLTYRCNERCVHCYLDHDDKGEMTTQEIKNILDQLAEAGKAIPEGPRVVAGSEAPPHRVRLAEPAVPYRLVVKAGRLAETVHFIEDAPETRAGNGDPNLMGPLAVNPPRADLSLAPHCRLLESIHLVSGPLRAVERLD